MGPRWPISRFYLGTSHESLGYAECQGQKLPAPDGHLFLVWVILQTHFTRRAMSAFEAVSSPPCSERCCCCCRAPTSSQAPQDQRVPRHNILCAQKRSLMEAFRGHCQTNLNGPAKGAGLRRSGRQLTATRPGRQRGSA